MRSKLIDFHISYACVNNCDFCSEFFQIQELRGHFVPFPEVKRDIIKKRKEGFDFIHFTGGEPTLHPQFLEIVKCAKQLGFGTQVGTNGVMFKDPAFCKKVLPYLDRVSFSIHEHLAQPHDRLVGRKGAFHDLKKALHNLQTAGHKSIFANVVITKKNFRAMAGIIRFLADEGCVQVLISNVAPEGAAEANYAKLAPRINKWKRIVPKISALAEKHGMIIHFFGLPLCAVHNFSLSNDISWDPRVTIERIKRGGKINGIITKSAAPDRKRIKPPVCRTCALARHCFGIFRQYYALHGDGELEPFSDQ
jgi:MoaA/NifB/PqqE/SkfB family radical SAM enzyme